MVPVLIVYKNKIEVNKRLVAHQRSNANVHIRKSNMYKSIKSNNVRPLLNGGLYLTFQSQYDGSFCHTASWVRFEYVLKTKKDLDQKSSSRRNKRIKVNSFSLHYSMTFEIDLSLVLQV